MKAVRAAASKLGVVVRVEEEIQWEQGQGDQGTIMCGIRIVELLIILKNTFPCFTAFCAF